MHSIRARLAAAALVALTAMAPAANAQTRVEVGLLECTVAGGTGFIIGSSKTLECIFKRPGGAPGEHYVGTISKFGIDIGKTSQSAIVWAVLAPTAQIPPKSLNGSYGGLSGEATVGVGLGANAMIGGSAKNIVLQPLSVQSQQGLNIAAGIAALDLRAD